MPIKRQHQIYSTKDLLSLDTKAERWIIKGVFPEVSKIIVFGDGSTYKSTIIFDLCVAVASGRDLFGQFTVNSHGPVLLVSTEGSLADNRDRILGHFRAHGVEPSDIPLYFCRQPFVFDDPEDIDELESILKKLRPIFVVMDPLDSFFSGEENSAKETKRIRAAVHYLSEEYKTSFCIIHHSGKIDKSSPRGTSAWYDWADTVMQVTKRKDTKTIPGHSLEVVTANLTKQRNKATGHVFSAVPIIDNALSQITMVYYNNFDPTALISRYIRTATYNILRLANTPMTTNAIAEVLKVRQEKVIEALTVLESEGLAARDAVFDVPCGVGGYRKVIGWRPLVRMNIVDAAEVMIKTLDEEELQYKVEPDSPDKPKDTGRLPTNGNGKRSGTLRVY